MMPWIWLLLASLEIHGLVGRDALQVDDLLRDHLWSGTLLLNAGSIQTWGDALVFRCQGMLLMQATQGNLPGAFAGAQIATVEAWAPETLHLWNWTSTTDPRRTSQAQVALQAASVEYRWRAHAWELGRFPVSLGLNPWFSVLDPLRLQPRFLPLLEYAGVDGFRWTLRTAWSEAQAFWIPARSDTARWGTVFHLYLPGFDALGQVLRIHRETHTGVGIQGNLLEGVLRLEGAWIQPRRGVSETRHTALQVSYSRAWEIGTLELIFVTSDDPRFVADPSGTTRWIAFWNTERERWGGFLGLDGASHQWALWTEAHYWFTSALRVFVLGAYGSRDSEPKSRWFHASVGLSWYP